MIMNLLLSIFWTQIVEMKLAVCWIFLVNKSCYNRTIIRYSIKSSSSSKSFQMRKCLKKINLSEVTTMRRLPMRTHLLKIPTRVRAKMTDDERLTYKFNYIKFNYTSSFKLWKFCHLAILEAFLTTGTLIAAPTYLPFFFFAILLGNISY